MRRKEACFFYGASQPTPKQNPPFFRETGKNREKGGADKKKSNFPEREMHGFSPGAKL